MSHGWATIPSRTRVSVRRIPRPGVPLRVPCMAPGYARLHPIPAPGTSRVRHPKGRTTARAGSHWATKEPRPALGQPGPRSESGTRLGSDPLKLGVSVNPAALARSAGDRQLHMGQGGSRCAALASGWKEVVLASYWGTGAHITGLIRGPSPNYPLHAPRRARPAGIGLRHPGSQREDGCMQPWRSRGNQLPGRWTGA